MAKQLKSKEKTSLRENAFFKENAALKENIFVKALHNSNFRLFCTSILSGGWDLLYAIFNIVLAFCYKSYWYLTIGVYYFFLGGMKALIVAHGRSHRDKRKPEWVVNHVGIAFFLLSIVFSGTVVLSIMEGRGTAYNTIIMITIATYTFYMFVLAVMNIIKVRKSRDIKTVTLRNISMGGAFVSMFSLEKSMMATFGEGDAQFTFLMEVISGAVIFLILVALGINLIIVSRRIKSDN